MPSLSLLAWCFRRLLPAVLSATAFAAAGSTPAGTPPVVLVFGDSLSAGYGIRSEDAWPALLVRRLAQERRDYTVVNLSISGETTAGGRSRLPAALGRHRPAIVVLALGANDGLRGLPVRELKANLGAMIDAARRAGAAPLLVGMRLPPNYGAYATSFDAAFGELAREKKVPLAPFLLDGIAGDMHWFQPDGLHPTRDAQPRMLDNVWPRLAPLLTARK